MEQLLDPLYVGLHIINLIVMVVVLRLLLYKPMKKFMDKRRAAVAEETSVAEAALVAAQTKEEELIAKSVAFDSKVKTEYNQILQQASVKAAGILSSAKEDAKALAAAAEKQVAEIKVSAVREQESAAAELAVDIAAAVLQRQLTPQEHEQLLAASLEEAKKYEV